MDDRRPRWRTLPIWEWGLARLFWTVLVAMTVLTAVGLAVGIILGK